MKKSLVSFLLFSLLCSAPCIVSPAFADEIKIDVSQPNGIESTLKSLIGKSVTVSTGAGESVSGVLEAVGPDAVKIKELSGKEFYAAVVKIASITSVVYRAK